MVLDTTPAVSAHRSGGVLTSLQAGRALAALAVVFHHANMSATELVGGMPRWAPSLGYGALGVDFFFVLSGFIIYHSSQGYDVDRRWVAGFLLRRGMRIYLPYWPVGIGLALLYTLLPGFGGGDHAFSWLSTVTLIPTDRLPALIPAWTLQHEVFFYLIFSLLIWARLLWVGLTAWVALLLLLWAPNGPEGSVFLSSMNIEFVAGIVAAHMVMRDRVRPILCLLVGAAFVIAYFIQGPLANSLFFGLGVAFLVAWVASAEKAGRVRAPGWAVLLGNASYALYLVHNPLLALTTRLAGHVWASWWAAMAFGIAMSLGVGLLYYFIYEKPALRLGQRFLKRALDAATPPVPRPPARS